MNNIYWCTSLVLNRSIILPLLLSLLGECILHYVQLLSQVRSSLEVVRASMLCGQSNHERHWSFAPVVLLFVARAPSTHLTRKNITQLYANWYLQKRNLLTLTCGGQICNIGLDSERFCDSQYKLCINIVFACAIAVAIAALLLVWEDLEAWRHTMHNMQVVWASMLCGQRPAHEPCEFYCKSIFIQAENNVFHQDSNVLW